MAGAARVRLEVRVHPGARRAGLTGRMADGSLKVAVTAAPEEGRANRALGELLAAVLGVPPRQVTVVRGATARRKLVEVEGLDEAEAARRIAAALREAGHGE